MSHVTINCIALFSKLSQNGVRTHTAIHWYKHYDQIIERFASIHVYMCSTDV